MRLFKFNDIGHKSTLYHYKTQLCIKIQFVVSKILIPDCRNCDVRGDSIFCTLTDKEWQKLNETKSSRAIKKGQVIFFENDTVKGLHSIRAGKIKIYKTLDDGGMQILRISKPGDIIGYRGLLGNGKYIGTAETLEDAEICFIPKQTIMELISSNLQFSLDLMSKFASDLSEAEEKSIRFIQKSSKERLAEALLMLETTFGIDDNGFIQLNLTRHEIAAFAGLATETIIRCLRAWEELGILDLDKKHIKILDKAQLIAISNTPE